MNELEILKNLVVYNSINKKIRVGRIGDGGYIIIDEYNYDFFISAGAGGGGRTKEDISFEIDFRKKYSQINGLLFDGTVDVPQNLPSQIKFIKKNIGSNNSDITTNLKEYVENYNDVFIKMDIDGHEWDWILSFKDSFKKIKQIVFEAHGMFDAHEYFIVDNNKILKSLQILNETHYLVHAHPNNIDRRLVSVENVMYPIILELTFIRKDCKINGLNTTDLPIENLDYPNGYLDINGVVVPDHNINVWPFNSKNTHLKYKFFGQNNEDEIIQNYFDKDYISGCIDVGASDGVVINNTLLFEQLGWYCLCIEPNPFYFKQLKQNRLNTVNYAISNVNDDLSFNIVDFGNHHEDAISGLKTDERLIVQHKNMGFNIDIRKIIVEVITLDKCIEDFYKYDKIDFISIDTEGTELDVLKGFSIEKWNPKLLIIENNFEDLEIEEYLKQYDYKKDKRIGVNDFYIKKYINN